MGEEHGLMTPQRPGRFATPFADVPRKQILRRNPAHPETKPSANEADMLSSASLAALLQPSPSMTSDLGC